MKKKVKIVFKPYPIFLNSVFGAWCVISVSATAHTTSHWTILSRAQKDTLPPLASILLLRKMGTEAHVLYHHDGPHLQWGGWAKTAPFSHLVRVQWALPRGAKGIAGPGIDHPCSGSRTRPSSTSLLSKAPIHKPQQRPGLSAQTSAPLASGWRWSGLCLPTAELTPCLHEQQNQYVPVSSISLSISATGYVLWCLIRQDLLVFSPL